MSASQALLIKLAVATLMIVACGVANNVLGRVSSLTCERPEPSLLRCQKSDALYGLIPLTTSDINELSQARVETYCDDGCTYEVILKTEAGDVSLTGYASSGADPKFEQAEQINSYLSSREAQELQIQGDSSGAYLIGIATIVALVIAIFIIRQQLSRKS